MKMNNLQLTRHFHLNEFTRSAMADANGIDNVPSLAVVSNLQYLCQQVLEPLRLWADQPVVINSGYRCSQLNQLVGGVTNSQHLTGEAADIRLPDKATGQRYAEFILENCRFDQLLFEHHSSGTYWLHVSCKREGNRQIFRPNFNVQKS